MTTVTMDLPESVLSALRCTPDDLSEEMRLVAAATWYEQGKISQEVAAQVAGLNRTGFLLGLARTRRDSFQVDPEDLDRELDRA